MNIQVVLVLDVTTGIIGAHDVYISAGSLCFAHSQTLGLLPNKIGIEMEFNRFRLKDADVFEKSIKTQ
jgi:hypothetical protein